MKRWRRPSRVEFSWVYLSFCIKSNLGLMIVYALNLTPSFFSHESDLSVIHNPIQIWLLIWFSCYIYQHNFCQFLSSNFLHIHLNGHPLNLAKTKKITNSPHKYDFYVKIILHNLIKGLNLRMHAYILYSSITDFNYTLRSLWINLIIIYFTIL